MKKQEVEEGEEKLALKAEKVKKEFSLVSQQVVPVNHLLFLREEGLKWDFLAV